MRYTRTCCLTTGEKKLLEGADELFMKVRSQATLILCTLIYVYMLT